MARAPNSFFAALLITFGMSACSDSEPEHVRADPTTGDEQSYAEADATPAPARAAEAELATTKGVDFEGEASFQEVPEGVRVVLKLDGAKPGKRGVHVHERGDCSDISAKSMGEHFAPAGKHHGLPHSPERHLGDLGNITIGPDGKGTLEYTVAKATLEPNGRESFLGKAIVVHASEDVGTEPSGASGEPVACGVIEEASAPAPEPSP